MNRRVKLIIVGLMSFRTGFGVFAEDVVPDYAHVAYSQNESYNWLNIYVANGTTTGAPTAVYVWAHGNGQTADRFDEDLWQRLSTAGISAVSWESVAHIESSDDIAECAEDAAEVFDFIAEHAAEYHFDTNKIVIGGTSRGSCVIWPFANDHPERVKGIYSTGALPDPVWTGSWDPRMDVNSNSPPFLFSYPASPTDGNIHNPQKGLLIQERYTELGIGDRATVEHSLKTRKKNRWDFIVDFIQSVTAE